MNQISLIKLGAAGFVGWVAGMVGGDDVMLNSLLILMIIDYCLGTISAIMGKSTKTITGALSSAAGFNGIAKKITILMLVIVSVRIDALLGSNFVRNGSVIFFAMNEIISIVENTGKIGVKIPSQIKNAIEVLKNKSEET